MFDSAISEARRLSDPRKIVFVECAAAMGGVQFSTLYLVQHLDPARWTPIVVCPEEGDLTEACRRLHIQVDVLDQPKLRSTSFRIRNDVRLPDPMAWLWDVVAMLIASRRLARFLAQTKPHLVVTKGLFSHFYGGLAARQLGIPCIWHVQDFISERFLGLYRRAFGLAARVLPNHIIADGAAIGRQLNPVKDRLSVILNGVDSNVFQPGTDGASVRAELGLPAGAIVIGHVGRMTPWKGQHYLLEAFARIARESPNAYLVFVGDPVFDTDSYQNKLLNLTAELGLVERVRFAGYRHDMPEVLAAMDVFAFTSVEKDTSPLTLLSAMASGLPIVAFAIEGVRELVDEGEQLLLVTPREADALAESLVRLLSDPKLRHRLGASARRQAEAKFSLERHVTSIEEVFLNLDQQTRSAYRKSLSAVADHPLANGRTVAKHSLRP
ncbi:MAG TPA: glycosyltransferase family 4 protein [Pyrinomonadaceae bacterium]